ncbi:aminoacyl-tRNA deacylase [Rhizohabitans arisaemae]|uniref:aminoacyl-tRNA deacylase n=1 Tax=Rhizohabitans arisaemae TaxID=2720610 RepID=UPI0024B06926|nr:YbaK/EbsC family protein [Rhizohabitans arisaemae]
MKDALAIHRWLLAHQIHHEIVRLPRPLTCADDLPEILGLLPRRCVSVTVFDDGRILTAVLTFAKETPNTDAVAAVLGSRHLRPASPLRINLGTEYAADLVSPVLLPQAMNLLVDQRLFAAAAGAEHPVYAATGERRTALKIMAADLFGLIGARPVDLGGRVRIPVPRTHGSITRSKV